VPQGAGPHQGEALAHALRSRGFECSAAQAAPLADFLLRLIECGVLVADTPHPSSAVHGDALGAEPSTVAQSLEPEGIARGTGLRGGGRVAFAESGSVVRRADGREQDPNANNMGSSIHQSCGDAE